MSSRADLHALLSTSAAFNIDGCGDLTAPDKHFIATSKHRKNTSLAHENVAMHTDRDAFSSYAGCASRPLPFGCRLPIHRTKTAPSLSIVNGLVM